VRKPPLASRVFQPQPREGAILGQRLLDRFSWGPRRVSKSPKVAAPAQHALSPRFFKPGALGATVLQTGGEPANPADPGDLYSVAPCTMNESTLHIEADGDSTVDASALRSMRRTADERK
jgi:hypothetical protein